MKNLLKIGVFLCLSVLSGCSFLDELIQDETPTKTKMEGVWEVTAAYNEMGESIIDSINFPVTFFSLSSDQTVVSTAGPMIMYVVYGGGKYTSIASKVDQIFNYTGIDFTGGEWAISGGVADKFTLEMKLEGVPGQKTFTEFLGLLNIGNDYLDVVVRHKFMDVSVSFKDESTMYWDFNDETFANYYTKDKYLNDVEWLGWSTDKFSKCSFVLEKRVGDIKDLVKNAVTK